MALRLLYELRHCEAVDAEHPADFCHRGLCVQERPDLILSSRELDPRGLAPLWVSQYNPFGAFAGKGFLGALGDALSVPQWNRERLLQDVL